ncbi:hypothetical protein SOM26_08635 [Sphingomonas sp. CFBP8993]|uniref:hypothetical protein n=1 Tax=Sphingomonas sp. CFBP8993 TaxID=3096526 RepID=UPI002A6A9761|nr:hypothetical protein [Sphingomonas sp. CFBP8993]MDY0958749.1 hypothetical protein [Sphingomonas sp. CFBP8993]
MSGRPFFCALRDGNRKHPWRVRLAHGQATQALTTAASGINAKISGMMCFMVELPQPIQ